MEKAQNDVGGASFWGLGGISLWFIGGSVSDLDIQKWESVIFKADCDGTSVRVGVWLVF